MGCISSKNAVSVTPAFDNSGRISSGRVRVRSKKGSSRGSGRKSNGNDDNGGGGGGGRKNGEVSYVGELGESGRASTNGDSLSFRLRNLHKYVEGDQVAAGWPAWLSAVAGEAIQGWVPLKANAFMKLEKIGQGTYSSVYRARELQTGKIVALKKVRFDNFEPESVRFMAREIVILRKLDHPNVIKLEGIITSRFSCSIYLVFDYMEHDLTGLISCPDIRFSESQIKCYMKQLLSGLEHCHLNGMMHRDIKGSNVLVNNEGILKIADFGLGNFCNSGRRQPLTSRVVTLWYRPPELLLGSTDYGASVDLWSVGCVFAELLVGRPILQGRTEVEQLHKIFKLCGSPCNEYWKKSKLPHATLFKPQQPYDSSLRETFKDLPPTAVSLIETLLSVEPYKRGTASSALSHQYFSSKPYACDPSSFPRYPPNKEIDARNREEAMMKKMVGRGRANETRKASRKPCGEDLAVQTSSGKNQSINVSSLAKGEDSKPSGESRKSSIDRVEEIARAKHASQGDIPFSGPLQVPSSSGFAWAKRRKGDRRGRSHRGANSKSHLSITEPAGSFEGKNDYDSRQHDNGYVTNGSRTNSNDSYNIPMPHLQRKWSRFGLKDSFDGSDVNDSQELSLQIYLREMEARRVNSGFHNKGEKVDFSGPLLTQGQEVDDFLEKQERHIRQAVRKSWLQKEKKQGKWSRVDTLGSSDCSSFE